MPDSGERPPTAPWDREIHPERLLKAARLEADLVASKPLTVRVEGDTDVYMVTRLIHPDHKRPYWNCPCPAATYRPWEYCAHILKARMSLSDAEVWKAYIAARRERRRTLLDRSGDKEGGGG